MLHSYKPAGKQNPDNALLTDVDGRCLKEKKKGGKKVNLNLFPVEEFPSVL